MNLGTRWMISSSKNPWGNPHLGLEMSLSRSIEIPLSQVRMSSFGLYWWVIVMVGNFIISNYIKKLPSWVGKFLIFDYMWKFSSWVGPRIRLFGKTLVSGHNVLVLDSLGDTLKEWRLSIVGYTRVSKVSH